jgi:hypothetical protein
MTFQLSRTEWFFIITWIMLGFVMYWTGIVVQPTMDIAENQQDQINIALEQNEMAIQQNDEIIGNQNNNTALIIEMFERQNKLLANQIILVTKLTNATNTIQNASTTINGEVEKIIGQSLEVAGMIQMFRESFSPELYGNQTAINKQILDNVTAIGDEIRILRNEVVNLTKLSANITTNT